MVVAFQQGDVGKIAGKSATWLRTVRRQGKEERVAGTYSVDTDVGGFCDGLG